MGTTSAGASAPIVDTPMLQTDEWVKSGDRLPQVCGCIVVHPDVRALANYKWQEHKLFLGIANCVAPCVPRLQLVTAVQCILPFVVFCLAGTIAKDELRSARVALLLLMLTFHFLVVFSCLRHVSIPFMVRVKWSVFGVYEGFAPYFWWSVVSSAAFVIGYFVNAYSAATMFYSLNAGSGVEHSRFDHAFGQATFSFIGLIFPSIYIPVVVFAISEMKLIYGLIVTWTWDHVQQSVGLRYQDRDLLLEVKGGKLNEVPLLPNNGRTVLGPAHYSDRFRILIDVVGMMTVANKMVDYDLSCLNNGVQEGGVGGPRFLQKACRVVRDRLIWVALFKVSVSFDFQVAQMTVEHTYHGNRPGLFLAIASFLQMLPIIIAYLSIEVSCWRMNAKTRQQVFSIYSCVWRLRFWFCATMFAYTRTIYLFLYLWICAWMQQ